MQKYETEVNGVGNILVLFILGGYMFTASDL